VADLLDLIHRANPTGRELGVREAEVGYAQKARLQSLLTHDEVQVLARRAEAWLALSPPPGRRRFAKIMALAALIDAHEGAPDQERDELPVPGATWDRSRIDDVVRRAAAWLEAQGSDERDGHPSSSREAQLTHGGAS
jgi:hypothetical protein